MEWITLNDLATLDQIDADSKAKPQLIFKHSTRCSISVTVEQRLKNIPESIDATCYYLDLLQYRNISNSIADKYQVHHESPQVIIIKDGAAIYDESHMAIRWDEIETAIV